jgi:NADH:ubiquinone oxidoreductase subunit E
MQTHLHPPATEAPDVAALLARHGNAPQSLVQILREFQAVYGWLPRDALARAGRRTWA